MTRASWKWGPFKLYRFIPYEKPALGITLYWGRTWVTLSVTPLVATFYLTVGKVRKYEWPADSSI